jgi:hypothetical protein
VGHSYGAATGLVTAYELCKAASARYVNHVSAQMKKQILLGQYQ